jgi:hypothetical protein
MEVEVLGDVQKEYIFLECLVISTIPLSPVRDGFDEVIKPVPTSKVVDVVSGDVVFREGMHVRHRAFFYPS